MSERISLRTAFETRSLTVSPQSWATTLSGCLRMCPERNGSGMPNRYPLLDFDEFSEVTL